MALGDADEKGPPAPAGNRPNPHPAGGYGHYRHRRQQDVAALAAMGIPLDDSGWPAADPTGETTLPGVFLIGDVQRGPSSIVSAIGNARRAADAILREKILPTTISISGETTSIRRIFTSAKGLSPSLRWQGIAGRRSWLRRRSAAWSATTCAANAWTCAQTAPTSQSPCRDSANRLPDAAPRRLLQRMRQLRSSVRAAGQSHKDKITVFSLAQDFANSSNPASSSRTTAFTSGKTNTPGC